MLNWHKIKTASANASHIPLAIQELSSADEDTRLKAYWKIDNYVIVQSDLYEAAFYVIEPLVELLEKPYTVDRIYPLQLLIEIATGGNGSTKINFNDNGNTFFKELELACKEKFSQLKERIKKIKVESEKEIKELDFLLESIS